MGALDTKAFVPAPDVNLRLPGRPLKRLAICVLVAAIIVALAITGYFVNCMVLNHNFHIVSAGRVYRSGQLDTPALTQLVHENGIKSILNLRGGANTGSGGWYNAETNAARELGVQYYDYELSASEELTDKQLEKIVNMVENAPKPLLIHCKSGADRSGLVGALYLYSVEGKPAKIADRELTMLYGHVPFWQFTAAMDHSFWHYVETHEPAAGARTLRLDSALTRQEGTNAASGAN